MRGVEILHEVAARAPARASPPKADAACRRRAISAQMIEVSGGNFEARHLRDLGGRLADALRIHRPVRRDQQLAERFASARRCRCMPLRLEQADDAVAQAALGDDRLLARADRAVIERLAGDDLRDRVVEVRGSVHQHRHVARTDAERRLAAGIRGLHDARVRRSRGSRSCARAASARWCLRWWRCPRTG